VSQPRNFSIQGITAYILLLVYPFAVYLLLDRLGAGVLGAVLVVLLLLRNPSFLSAHRWVLIPALLVLLLFMGVGSAESELLLRMYPVGINFTLFVVFGHTVLRPPTIVTRIARASGIEMTVGITTYTRNVTLVWCTFFVVNGLIALYIALNETMNVWLLYNGILSYCFMGLLFGGEYLFRRYYIGRPQPVAVSAASKRPDVLSSEVAGDRAEYLIHVRPDSPWFAGHFPGQPVLPGVVQVDWAIMLAADLGVDLKKFAGIPRVKFSSLVLPNCRLRLILEKTSVGIKFVFSSDEGIHSQGSIRFG